MPIFRDPMIDLYSRDLSRAVAFYSELGFVEVFRTPASGEPVHIELTVGFTLGIATMEAAKENHGGARVSRDVSEW
jgi:catechol 2,3-dioxygenase-like lactoylglutathione lyase family enzyme